MQQVQPAAKQKQHQQEYKYIMILRELYYFDKKTMEPVEDQRYNPDEDVSVVNLDDTRKTRLTLKDINKARLADDMHRKEATKDLDHVRAMYGLAAQAQGQGESI
jgi:tRNA A37 N6-isopentenylltransferase MiaA